ncbi:hypothetical protein TWF281_004067 [Arthrobotrys megalospora]
MVSIPKIAVVMTRSRSFGILRALVTTLVILKPENGAFASPFALEFSKLESPGNETSLLPPFLNITNPTNAIFGLSACVNTTNSTLETARLWSNGTSSAIAMSPSIQQPSNTTLRNSSASGGRAVPPSFFYDEDGMFVTCSSPEVALDVFTALADADDVDTTGYDMTPQGWRQKWGHIKAEMAWVRGGPESPNPNLEGQLSLIREYHEMCAACGCNPDGTMKTVQRYSGEKNCRRIVRVALCVLVLSCYCTARLAQPRVPLEQILEPLHTFQEAINQIPDFVRYHPLNNGWAWQVDPTIAEHADQTLTFTGWPTRNIAPEDEEFMVNVAPEGEAPFFLSGPHHGHEDPHDPGEGSSSGSFWQPHGDFGGLGGGGSGSFRLAKRGTVPQIEDGDIKDA